MEQSTAIKLTLELTYKIINTAPSFILEGSDAKEKEKNLADFILSLSEGLVAQEENQPEEKIILKSTPESLTLPKD